MNLNLTDHRRVLVGLILVGAGAVLLLAELFGGLHRYLWPFFIIAPGAALLGVALLSDHGTRKLAVPGAVITGIGAILFFQNLFNHYESWAYVWALIPFCVGLGMMLADDDDETGEHGPEAARHLMTWSLALFVVFAVLFELFIFEGGVRGARVVVPLVLIVAGAAVFLGWGGASGSDKSD